jgi:hypothetical protein
MEAAICKEKGAIVRIYFINPHEAVLYWLG